MDGKISEEEFVAHDIKLWREVRPEIHRDDIMRCYSGVGLIEGARKVVENLKKRGVFVAIVSSGVDIFVGAIANMLKVDDWVANGFEWDDEGWLLGGLPTRVLTHDKGIMVEKLARINGFEPSQIVSVGDSSTDLSMKMRVQIHWIQSKGERALEAFMEAGVPVVEEKDLSLIWPLIFPGEEISLAR